MPNRKSRFSQMADLILHGSDEDARKLNRVLSDPVKEKLLTRWLLDDPYYKKAPPKKVRRGIGSY